MSDTCSIQKKDGKISFIDIAKEIVIPLNYHNVQCIQSIKDFKYHFFAVANQNHLYFIDEIGNSNLVCNSPLPFKQAFHGFSYREPSHRTNHFYVACATKSTVLTIFRYVKNSSTFLTIRNLVITKNEKQTISTVTSFDYQDANHSLSKYILVSTFNNAYLINFTLLLSKIDENSGMDRNEDYFHETLSYVRDMSFFFFNETTFNNCDPFPPFISANSNYIVFLNYHNISIYPISSFVIEENRNKFDFLILSNRKIEGILNCSNNNDLYVNLYNKSVQFILTQFYIIIFSKYYILAISLETGNVAIRYPFRDMVIESIFPDDVNNSFYIITNKNVFQGHILFENNSINAHPINIERESMLKQNITHYCNFNYALLYYLKNHNYHFALNLIKEKLHKSNDIIYHVILQFLYDEITIISGISQSQIFIESQDLDIDMFLKNLYIRHLRYLDQTNILKLSHKIFIESFKSESLIYEMINQKLFSQDLLFSMIQLKNQSYFQSMAIIDSKTFLKSMNHFTFPIEKIFQSLLLLSKFINSETIIKYIDYFIERNKFSLFMEIILMGKCEQNLICNIDEIIYQIINRIDVELLDPIGILEKCKSKGFYKTGYLLAMRNNMHYIAKQCAKKSKDRKLKYDMENHFNIIYGNNYLIKSLEENHKVSLKDKLKQKGNTQMAIASELRNVNKEIKITRNQIKKEAQQFAYMKKELKKEDASKSSINTSFFCSNCKLMIHEKEYIEMPCGHIFHIQCMKKLLKMLGIIVTNDYEIYDKMANKTQNDDIDLNNMLFQDCPMCGMISTQICSEHYIFANKWNYDININETKSDLF